ncbi:MAG TPA: LPS assembly lipoprotein LptE [Candidatus Polarisedimenticolia bacterium]|nr:LPS assembly lipoprotein LptE [Candidatus Polarisedimenticolia bacterium]
MLWSRPTIALPALALLGLLTLGACGWQPLYGKVNAGDGAAGGNAGPKLASVHILPIADRTGQNLYNALRDRMNPAGSPSNPQYDLVIQIQERSEQLLILQDQTASRTNLTLTASFQLYQRGNAAPVLKGSSRTTTSYDMLNDEFATIQSTSEARRRGALNLADDIANQLAVFLAQPSGG